MNTNRPIDLNALQDMVHAQQSGAPIPPELQKPITVDRNGNLNIGDENNVNTTTVPTDTFHGRREDEYAIVRKYMPSSTMAITAKDGTQGWLYEFECKLKRRYKIFAYFDGSYYQAIVVEPFIEQKYRNAHKGHIFNTGRICFGTAYNNGRLTLNDVYSKSVLWANGISAMILSGTDVFPFSLNNL